MKIAVELDFTYEQILSLIKQLPKKDQLRLEKNYQLVNTSPHHPVNLTFKNLILR